MRTYCAKHGLTLNAFFTTAFALALKAYTGSESAVFATIYNGRGDSRLARSVSMFVKTLPVVLEMAPEQGVEDAIGTTQNWLLNAMTHDIFSFAEIHETWGIGADVLFAYQGEVERDQILCGYPATEVEISLSQSKALFGLDVWLDGDAVVYETEYDPAHYGPYTVEGFVHMLDIICGELLVREKLKDVRLVDEADGQAILALHDTDWPVAERPAYRLLQDSAERWPDRTALVAVDRSLTYAELNSEANAVGHALVERGAKPETVVAVMADRDSRAYVMRQGVLKSGGAFVPIDPEYPEERVRYILEDSGARLLVTTERIAGKWGNLFSLMGVEIVKAEEAVGRYSRENLNVPLDWESLCYVIYTSGSTGKPKGVMLTNHNLVNFVDDDAKNREIQGYTRRGHVSLAIAALTFDFAIARGLEADGILTGAGRARWYNSTVNKILRNEKYYGDALLQKTYTRDFLTKSRVKNEGIVPQYYVQGDHEPIISKEMFLLVQEEIARRQEGKKDASGRTSRYSTCHCFSHIVYCDKCGGLFRRFHWNNCGCKSIVWRCSNRLEKAE